MTDTPPDWVLIEAAKRSGWVLIEAAKRSGWNWATPSVTIETYKENGPFRALCDMIAKHEQPPVDPDVEAVKRIMAKWYGYDSVDIHNNTAFARAVAQYKKEIARD